MMLEMITDTIAAQPDLHVVGSIGREECLLNAVKRTSADLVVVGDGGLRSEEYDELLHECSRLKVIELVGRDGHGLRYELCLSRVPLGELSSLSLLDAIRASARSTTGSDNPTHDA